MIAKTETGSLEKEKRAKSGLVEPEGTISQLILGWAAMNELQKLQRI
ncbi:hypothetical protein ACFL5Z_17075 [Planctomycetota bacterium]